MSTDIESRITQPTHGVPAITPAGKGGTVLVIEDDRSLRDTLTYNLLRAGYRVAAAVNGADGLDYIRRQSERIDLVLLDLMLPGLHGLHVLRQLRRFSDVPVIILSAKNEEQDRIDGLQLGADDYVSKPFALRELMARVEAVVRRRAAPDVRPPSSLDRGPLQIEPERRRATVGEIELQLRPKEFGLLVTLALEPGRVFSRQELLDSIWGEEIFVDERTVDVHISWLRKKLSDAGMPSGTIRTVYGAGYRFIAPARQSLPGLQDGEEWREEVSLA
jgi:DNA-binding response OmpR family regulator